MNTDFIHKVGHRLKGGSPALLSGVAIAGVVTTAYLTHKAALKANEMIEEDTRENGHLVASNRWEHFKERSSLVWKVYIPPAASGVVTIGSIVASTRISGRRAAAAQAALVLSDRAYREYRDHIVEEYGEKKDKEIRDKIATERVRNNPPGEVIVISGNVLCCELHTGRYFQSDIETIRKAVNKINAQMLHHDFATMDDFYDLLGLQGTQYSGDMGWHSDKLLEVDFTSILTEDERPCLAFEYNYVKTIYEGLYR